MNTPESNQKDFQTLRTIAEKLKQDDIEATLLDMNSTHLPLHILSVPAQDDQTGEIYRLMLSFYPMEEVSFEGNRYLQIFMQFDVVLSEDSLPKLILMLPEINQKAPIGHFGFRYEESKAYYKYVLMVAENESDLYLKIKELVAFLPFIFQLITPSLEILKVGFKDIEAQ